MACALQRWNEVCCLVRFEDVVHIDGYKVIGRVM
jgi:hypothetical protein